jgi:hypothetical protein
MRGEGGEGRNDCLLGRMFEKSEEQIRVGIVFTRSLLRSSTVDLLLVPENFEVALRFPDPPFIPRGAY